MRYFDDNQWTYPVLGASVGVAAVLAKHKLVGDMARSEGARMLITKPSKFFKGVSSYKELKALEAQRDAAVQSMADIGMAKSNLSIKNPIRTSKDLIGQAKKTKKEWEILKDMNAAQQKKHGVSDIGEFGEQLKGGVSALGGATVGAVGGGYLIHKKKKRI